MHTGNTYRRLAHGQAALNSLYKRYRADATKRGIAFDLTTEQFASLVKRPCFYCESPPSREAGNRGGNGKLLCSGVDRVDNAAGYTADNCEPCCVACNSAKNSVSKEIVYKLYHRLFTQPEPRAAPP